MKAPSDPNTRLTPRPCNHPVDFVRPLWLGGWRRWVPGRPATIWWSRASQATHRAGDGRRWRLGFFEQRDHILAKTAPSPLWIAGRYRSAKILYGEHRILTIELAVV